jgi:hypothetical protein
MTTWDRERTALHAGHAVVAWSFGVTVGCIHLDSEKQGGHAKIAPATHLEPFEQIAIALAGFESEQLFKFPGNKAGAFDDLHDKVPSILREIGTSEDEPRGRLIRDQGRACAEDLLRQCASKVRQLTRHLIEHHYIDPVDFETMMRGAK